MPWSMELVLKMNFIEKFVSSLSDDELDQLRCKIHREDYNRMRVRLNNGFYVSLNEAEKTLCKTKISEAAMSYSKRTDVSVREAVFVCMSFRDMNLM